MGDLDDQLRRMADRRAERTPVTNAADVMGVSPLGMRRAPVWFAAAAMLAVLAGLAIWLTEDRDDGAEVFDTPTTTVADDAPTTTQAPDTTTTAVPPTGTERALPSPDVAYDAAAATPEGIELRLAANRDAVDFLPVGPTELAFVLDGPIVVYQRRTSGVYPPIRVATAIDDRLLELGADVWVNLLDAAVVDGVPTALVTRRTGDTPETADERLLLVDLRTGEASDIGSFGGWESGLADARFVDGAIVLQWAAEGYSWIEVIDYAGTRIWSIPEEFDQGRQIAVDDESVYWVDAGWNDDLTAPSLSWQQFGLRTGASGESLPEYVEALTVSVDAGFVDPLADGYCDRPEWSDTIVTCGQSSGRPVLIDLDANTIEAAPGFTAGVVTSAARQVSATDP